VFQLCLKNPPFRYTPFSSLKEWVYGTSYCSKTGLRINVSLLIDILSFRTIVSMKRLGRGNYPQRNGDEQSAGGGPLAEK
jgi:hypothetical protein